MTGIRIETTVVRMGRVEVVSLQPAVTDYSGIRMAEPKPAMMVSRTEIQTNVT